MSSSAPSPYEVRLRSRRVGRQLDALPRTDHRRVTAAIQGLATVPRPAGSTHLVDDIFRIRVGRYRVIYQVDDRERIVEIGGVRRRTEQTYRNIRDMF